MAISRKGNLVAGAVKNGADVPLTLSSAAAAGDIIYLFGGHHTAGGGTYGDTGGVYTQVKAPDTTGAFGFGVWRLVCTGAVTTVTGKGNAAGNDVTAYACAVYSGGDGTTPEDVAIPAFATASSTNPDAPSIDPVTNDCAIIACAIKVDADSSPGTPANYATPINATATDTSGALQITITDRVISGSAAEDPPAFGTWAGTGLWKAITVAVRPGAVAVSASPTGVAATGAVGTATVSTKANVSVTGVNGTGAVGTATDTAGVGVSVTGVAATGNAGNLSGLALLDENGLAILDENGEVILDDGGILGKANVTLTGVAAAGQPGDVTIDLGITPVDVTLDGVNATGAVGTATVTGAANVTLTGVNASGAVGTATVTGAANVTLTGVNATGAIGTATVTGAANTTLTGVNATGAVGTATVTGAANVTFDAAVGAGQVGTVSVTAGGNVDVSIDAVTATGAVGDLTATGAATVTLTGVAAVCAAADLAIEGIANVTLDGVAANGQVGDLTVTTGAAVGAQKDGDPDYWNLPWFEVEGDDFHTRLRAKAITALEEAVDAAEAAEPAKAKRAARKAAKGLQAYAEAAGALLSDDAVAELGQTARELNIAASQWNRDDLFERVSNARMLILAYAAMQQDEEDALIALMVAA